MKTRLVNIWEDLKTSYWFIPTIMLITAYAAAMLLIWIDQHYMQDIGQDYFLLYRSSQDSTREMLSIIAAASITIAGVAFSIVIVSLTLASSQFGPHLLRQYMKSKGAQVSLGVFVSTFLYAICVLRMMEADDADYIPVLAGAAAFLAAILIAFVLVYFIHHSAEALQISTVIGGIQDGLNAGILTRYPHRLQPGQAIAARREKVTPPRESRVIFSEKDGYLQAVNTEQLIKRAAAGNLLVEVDHAPGGFVVVGDSLMRVYADEPLEDADIVDLRATLIVGPKRTPEQDVEYYLNELVEIAVRALSPGINDFFTAYVCFDWLSASFSKLAGRQFPPTHHADEANTLRVICKVKSFETLFDHTYAHLKDVARPCAPVRAALKETLIRLSAHCVIEAHKNRVNQTIFELDEL